MEGHPPQLSSQRDLERPPEWDHHEHQEGGDGGQHRSGQIETQLHLAGCHLLLEEQFQAVGQGLENTPRTGPVRSHAVLHVGHNLALEPYQQDGHHQQESEDHHHPGDYQEKIDPVHQDPSPISRLPPRPAIPGWLNGT